jgi:two-component system chemotaxis response regulator CheB
MDGLTFLRKLMSQHPMPVVLCTDQAERAVTALEMGALEVIAKPDWRDAAKMAAWSGTLLESVRTAARAGHLSVRDDPAPVAAEARSSADAVLPRLPYSSRGGLATDRVIAIGVSTGGVQALQQLLPLFPADSPGVVIVQHMPLGFLGALAARLDNDPKIALEVAEARHHDPVRRGRAVLVPSDVHGLVRRTGSGYRVELVDGPKICIQRPSVEVLFRSTAQAAGPNAAGVILTGMGDDGAGGLLEMREAGALTIAQNQATCTVFGMPREAIRRGAAQQVLPLDRIAHALMAWDAGTEAGPRG